MRQYIFILINALSALHSQPTYNRMCTKLIIFLLGNTLPYTVGYDDDDDDVDRHTRTLYGFNVYPHI